MLVAYVVALAGVRLVERGETTVCLTRAVAAVTAVVATATDASDGIFAGCAEVQTAVTIFFACVVALARLRFIDPLFAAGHLACAFCVVAAGVPIRHEQGKANACEHSKENRRRHYRTTGTSLRHALAVA